ncbi:glycosyltransferase family 4 protein [Halorhabdus rudnickae]|uniref:glycosyltransferase family 4 protein n=1 Tax=Halorhabdus rudnickae TaxID=1775544 RepID=UPI00108391C9|nr:glycosyltransferase family 4 protein [Halorhabdus rudnickae]
MVPKVLMLGWGFPPNVSGGLDTAVGELFEQFDARADVEIELVLPAEYAPDREGIHGVPTGEGSVADRIDRLSGEFVEYAADADIVHSHDWFGYGPGSQAQAAHDLEWVTTFHSLTSDRNRYPPDREIRTEQQVVDQTDHLIAVSEVTRRAVREHYDGDAQVIYNGFSSVQTTGRDVAAELGIGGEMLFFVGRHTHQKGIDHLVYAMDRLDREEVTLVVGGTGHLTGRLKRFVEILGVEDMVEFVGYVPESELGDYYESADVFVSPSLAEPFGITIVESLSAGTRVVACESGAAEVLPEGCIVEVEPNSRSIATGIGRALDAGPLPDYEHRSWETVADEHVEFYREILDG